MAEIPPMPTRNSIPSEFSRKRWINHPSVFRRLRIRDVSDAFVEACLTDFEWVNRAYIDELVELELIVLNDDKGHDREHRHETLAIRTLHER